MIAELLAAFLYAAAYELCRTCPMPPYGDSPEWDMAVKARKQIETWRLW